MVHLWHFQKDFTKSGGNRREINKDGMRNRKPMPEPVHTNSFPGLTDTASFPILSEELLSYPQRPASNVAGTLFQFPPLSDKETIFFSMGTTLWTTDSLKVKAEQRILALLPNPRVCPRNHIIPGKWFPQDNSSPSHSAYK